MNKDIQLRGHCQCCGREQAVRASGNISLHGYKVENGWFNGVCGGEQYTPVEHDVTQANAIINHIKRDVANLINHLEGLESGRIIPGFAEIGFGKHTQIISYKDADEYNQQKALKSDIWNTKRRINMGNNFINDLQFVIDAFHGKPLTEVKKADAPVQILIGEKRVTEKGLVLTCTKIHKARIYWKMDNNKSSWTGSQAWRRMKKVNNDTTGI